MESKSTHGGSRSGSGRKSGKRVVYQTRLHPDRIKWIKKQAKQAGKSDCEIVEDAIDKRREEKP